MYLNIYYKYYFNLTILQKNEKLLEDYIYFI